MLLNPFYAITVDPTLTAQHEPIVSRKLWIGANIKLAKELGIERYLLEGNFPRTDEHDDE